MKAGSLELNAADASTRPTLERSGSFQMLCPIISVTSVVKLAQGPSARRRTLHGRARGTAQNGVFWLPVLCRKLTMGNGSGGDWEREI